MTDWCYKHTLDILNQSEIVALVALLVGATVGYVCGSREKHE